MSNKLENVAEIIDVSKLISERFINNQDIKDKFFRLINHITAKDPDAVVRYDNIKIGISKRYSKYYFYVQRIDGKFIFRFTGLYGNMDSNSSIEALLKACDVAINVIEYQSAVDEKYLGKEQIIRSNISGLSDFVKKVVPIAVNIQCSWSIKTMVVSFLAQSLFRGSVTRKKSDDNYFYYYKNNEGEVYDLCSGNLKPLKFSDGLVTRRWGKLETARKDYYYEQLLDNVISEYGYTLLIDSPVHEVQQLPEIRRKKDVYYDSHGYNRQGFDFEGFDPGGYNCFGFNRDGYDYYGYDQDGYDEQGLDINGFNRFGFLRDTISFIDSLGYFANRLHITYKDISSEIYIKPIHVNATWQLIVNVGDAKLRDIKKAITIIFANLHEDITCIRILSNNEIQDEIRQYLKGYDNKLIYDKFSNNILPEIERYILVGRPVHEYFELDEDSENEDYCNASSYSYAHDDFFTKDVINVSGINELSYIAYIVRKCFEIMYPNIKQQIFLEKLLYTMHNLSQGVFDEGLFKFCINSDLDDGFKSIGFNLKNGKLTVSCMFYGDDWSEEEIWMFQLNYNDETKDPYIFVKAEDMLNISKAYNARLGIDFPTEFSDDNSATDY